MKKVAIITGASSGLGRQFVIQTAKSHGFLDEIWVVARRADRLFELGVLVSNIVIRPIPLDLAKKTVPNGSEISWQKKSRESMCW